MPDMAEEEGIPEGDIYIAHVSQQCHGRYARCCECPIQTADNYISA